MQRERQPLPLPVLRRACIAIPVGIFTIGLVTGCPWVIIIAAVVAVIMTVILWRR
jgi:hypothetical protein